MYLLKWVGFLIVFIWTALVFHHGHFVHKSYSCSAFGGVAMFPYQHIQQALLKSRKISAPWNSCVSSCTVPAVPTKVCRCTKDSPEWVIRSHIWPVHEIQQWALQFPLKYREGLQKHFDPLQKSFLFYIPACKISYNNASGSLSAVTW